VKLLQVRPELPKAKLWDLQCSFLRAICATCYLLLQARRLLKLCKENGECISEIYCGLAVACDASDDWIICRSFVRFGTHSTAEHLCSYAAGRLEDGLDAVSCGSPQDPSAAIATGVSS